MADARNLRLIIEPSLRHEQRRQVQETLDPDLAYLRSEVLPDIIGRVFKQAISTDLASSQADQQVVHPSVPSSAPN